MTIVLIGSRAVHQHDPTLLKRTKYGDWDYMCNPADIDYIASWDDFTLLEIPGLPKYKRIFRYLDGHIHEFEVTGE